jgi:hypothetical protein
MSNDYLDHVLYLVYQRSMPDQANMISMFMASADGISACQYLIG